MKFTKEHEGKTIYAIPTGNNARRWGSGDSDESTRFAVIKVKRKYVEMMQEGYRRTENYCPETGATQSSINSGYGGNSGWNFFETLADIDRHKELNKKRKCIGDYFDWRNRSDWPDELIDKVYDLIPSLGE